MGAPRYLCRTVGRATPIPLLAGPGSIAHAPAGGPASSVGAASPFWLGRQTPRYSDLAGERTEIRFPGQQPVFSRGGRRGLALI